MARPAVWILDTSKWDIPVAAPGSRRVGSGSRPSGSIAGPVEAGRATRRPAAKSAVVDQIPSLPKTALPSAKVTNIKEGRESISFDVDQIGKPVLVRTSYFPNWTATGADGPYRVAPNQMVVVPTSKHVVLNYDAERRSSCSRMLLTAGRSLVLLFVFYRRWNPGDLRIAGLHRRPSYLARRRRRRRRGRPVDDDGRTGTRRTAGATAGPEHGRRSTAWPGTARGADGGPGPTMRDRPTDRPCPSTAEVRRRGARRRRGRRDGVEPPEATST